MRVESPVLDKAELRSPSTRSKKILGCQKCHLSGRKYSMWKALLVAGSPSFFLKDCQELQAPNLPALRSILRQGSRQTSLHPSQPLQAGWERLLPRASPQRTGDARTCGTLTSSTAPSAPRPGSSENRKRWARTSCPRRPRLSRGESGVPRRAGNGEERRAARLRARGKPLADGAASRALRCPAGSL